MAPAATVNGHEITRAEVDAFSRQQQLYLKFYGPIAVKNGSAQQADVDAALAAFRSSNPNTVPVAAASQSLSALIQQELYAQAVVAAGEKLPTQARVEAKAKTIADDLKSSGVPSTDLFPLVIENEARVTLLNDILKGTKNVTDAEREAQLRAAYQDQLASNTQVCLSLIVTNTEAEAQGALGRVDGGEPFATVAAAVSADAQTAANGGDAGCVAVTQVSPLFGPEIGTAKPGALFGPAPSQGQFLVVQVKSYDVPTFESLRSQLEASTPKGDATAARKALAKALRTVKVTVDKRFGTWNKKTASVTPPTDPKATTSTVATTVPADTTTTTAGN